MPQLPDHLLLAVLGLFVPLRAVAGLRRLQGAPDGDVPRVRLTTYRQILVYEWGLAAAVAGLWVAYGRDWAGLGLLPRWNGATIGVVAGLGIAIGLLARQQRRARQDEGAWDRLRERMARLERMLPHTRRELGWFVAISFTAGVCEELLYRGWLIWYLGRWLPIWPAALVAVAIFGIGHSYQGANGALRTGMAGAFFTAVYLLTGSLYLPMLLHFLVDAYSGSVMYQAYRRGAPAPPAAAAAPGEA
jgi:hypothetical protein